MADGIRAEVSIQAPAECPVATTSAAFGTPTYSVSRTASAGPDQPVTEEFMIEETPLETALDEDLQEVFTYGSKTVYRFEREQGVGCPCERIELQGCPVVDIHTRRGTLYLTFHAPDMETLRDALGELREGYPEVSVDRLIHTTQEADERSLVFVDRSQLTDRQEEVLSTAHRMGYFERPKGANASEVAEELGISLSTFTEHLAAAQTKILDAVLDE
ncbi:MAG: helix-turn-helix domain-containing protein [Haloferacaceae archaeon]